MEQYVPASLENVTQVAAYVVDKENQEEMKGIVRSANLWCKRKMTESGMAKDAMIQLEKYETALIEYLKESTCNDFVAHLITNDAVSDIVECN